MSSQNSSSTDDAILLAHTIEKLIMETIADMNREGKFLIFSVLKDDFGFSEEVRVEVKCMLMSELPPKDQETTTIEEKKTETVSELESKTADEKQMKSGICLCQKVLLLLFSNLEKTIEEKETQTVEENMTNKNDGEVVQAKNKMKTGPFCRKCMDRCETTLTYFY